MALLFMDGFEMGDHLLRYSVSSTATQSATTRFGTGKSIGTAGSGPQFIRALSAAVTKCIVGVAIRTTVGGDTNEVIQFRGDAGGTFHISVNIGTSGAITVRRGTGNGTLIASGGVFPFNVWNYLEVSCTISDTVGVVKVRINGVEVISFTGDTKNAGTNSTIDVVALGASVGTNNCLLDDCYICDDTGSAPWNDFLGDVRVATLSPTGAGNSTGLTASVGANWTCVDEQPYSATDFVSSSVAGTKDTYATADLPAGATAVLGVQLGTIAKKSDAGARSVSLVTRSAGTDYLSTAQALPTSDGWLGAVRPTDPATSAAWTVAAVNAMEIGVQVV